MAEPSINCVDGCRSTDASHRGRELFLRSRQLEFDGLLPSPHCLQVARSALGADTTLVGNRMQDLLAGQLFFFGRGFAAPPLRLLGIGGLAALQL